MKKLLVFVAIALLAACQSKPVSKHRAAWDWVHEAAQTIRQAKLERLHSHPPQTSVGEIPAPGNTP